MLDALAHSIAFLMLKYQITSYIRTITRLNLCEIACKALAGYSPQKISNLHLGIVHCLDSEVSDAPSISRKSMVSPPISVDKSSTEDLGRSFLQDHETIALDMQKNVSVRKDFSKIVAGKAIAEDAIRAHNGSSNAPSTK